VTSDQHKRGVHAMIENAMGKLLAIRWRWGWACRGQGLNSPGNHLYSLMNKRVANFSLTIVLGQVFATRAPNWNKVEGRFPCPSPDCACF
jgi:hypothetical protein